MLVYHFLNSEFGLQDLRLKRLKISQIMGLNDPFEFLGVDLSNRTLRKAMLDTKKQFAQGQGLICFSKSWKNPVQWAHYADNHKGMCLGFEIPDEYLCKVSYVEERIKTEPTTEKEMLDVLTTKFIHWSYEKEFRLFVLLNKEQIDNDLYFEPFADNIVLKRVIIGSNSLVTKKQVIENYGSSQDIEIFKSRPAFKSFQMVRNKRFE